MPVWVVQCVSFYTLESGQAVAVREGAGRAQMPMGQKAVSGVTQQGLAGTWLKTRNPDSDLGGPVKHIEHFLGSLHEASMQLHWEKLRN